MQESNKSAEEESNSPRYLGDRLLASIKSLVDGNQVRGSEISESRFRHCECVVSAEVRWNFHAEYSKKTIAGDASVSGAHYGTDRSAFVQEWELRQHQAQNDLTIRKQFQENVLAQKGGALTSALKEKLVWDFGKHSYSHYCGVCNGDKVQQCSNCHGRRKVSCYSCHGNCWVWQWRSRTNSDGQRVSEQFKESCSTCRGAGNLNCNTCHGSGKVRCNECSGQGFFTVVANTSAVAYPSINFAVQSNLYSNELVAYLGQIGSQQAASILNFSIHQESTVESKWIVQYACRSTVIEQCLKLRGKDYLAAAVGSGAIAFIKPPLFDDIFVEELQDLRKVYSNQKKSGINKSRAVNFFKKYAGQPVLDSALQLVARLSAEDRKYPSTAVHRACDGYISQSASAELGQCMTDLLDKVSPAYSNFAWMLVMSFPLLYQFVSIENTLELSRGSFWDSTGTIAMSFFFGFIFLLLISPIAWIGSAIHSTIQRQFIPKSYRQSGRNWVPFSKVLIIYIVLTFMAAIYGVSARFDIAPRLEGSTSNYMDKVVLKSLNSLIENVPWLKQNIPNSFRLIDNQLATDRSNSNDFLGLTHEAQCKSVWHSFSQMREGPQKEKWRQFYEVEYGSNNFHSNCVGSSLKRKCEVVRQFENLPQGAEKKKLRQLLEKANFKKPLFDRKMCN